MSARAFIAIMGLLALVYDALLDLLANVQRSKPLPPEVADVYDAGRYRTYSRYVAELERANLIHKVLSWVLTMIVIFLVPFEGLAGLVGGDPYLVALLTSAIFWVPRTVERFRHRYSVRFGIEGRYGINRLTRGRFLLDFSVGSVVGLLISTLFTEMVAFLGEHLYAWTDGYSVGLAGAVGLAVLMLLAVAGVSTISQIFNYRVMRREYEFTPLPDSPLRTKIEELLADTHRRVRNIYVYDESSKSTKKNAFVLRMLFTRDIGIADNFLTDTSERGLISVILHEIGHLKHHVGWRDVLGYVLGGLLAVVMVMLVLDPTPVLWATEWCRASFGLSAVNYALLVQLFGAFLEPVSAVFDLYNNWRSRADEYEADLEAVRAGYGEDLIHTFKQLSADELVNVNPHPVVELLTYDHPGMYHRIRAIRAAEFQMGSKREGEDEPEQLGGVIAGATLLHARHHRR